MKKLNQLSSLIFSLCVASNVMAQNANFIDHGFIPVPSINTGIRTTGGEFQSSMHFLDHVWVATDKGIWKNNISSQQWSLVGLSDKKITCIYKHPTLNKIFAGAVTGPLGNGNTTRLFSSVDGGTSWQSVTGAVNGDYGMIVMRPNFPNHLYASLSSFDFAVSTDAGATWNYVNNGSGGAIGYPVNIAFLTGDPNTLYFGSENPLDDAWIGKYTINSSNPTLLENFTYVITGIAGNQTWDNRRPNSLKTYAFAPNTLYVGHEGAFSKVNVLGTDQTQFIYESNGEQNKPYSYIYGQWTNPNNTNHLIFGGGGQGNNENNLQLYETFNEGVSFYKYTPTFGMNAPIVTNIIEIPNGKLAVVLTEDELNKVKLVIMEPSSLNLNEASYQERIKVYPNPTLSKLNIKCQLKIQELNITNTSGQSVLSKVSNENFETISLLGLPKGVYILTILTEQGEYIEKLIIE